MNIYIFRILANALMNAEILFKTIFGHHNSKNLPLPHLPIISCACLLTPSPTLPPPLSSPPAVGASADTKWSFEGCRDGEARYLEGQIASCWRDADTHWLAHRGRGALSPVQSHTHTHTHTHDHTYSKCWHIHKYIHIYNMYDMHAELDVG